LSTNRTDQVAIIGALDVTASLEIPAAPTCTPHCTVAKLASANARIEKSAAVPGALAHRDDLDRPQLLDLQA
jgi:hypothetical protein